VKAKALGEENTEVGMKDKHLGEENTKMGMKAKDLGGGKHQPNWR
jgi:hypothetical protein